MRARCKLHCQLAGDFISLGLTSGYLEFRFDIGSGAGLLRTPLKASMNEWHVAKFGRYLREGYLQLDKEPQVRGSSKGPMTGLDLRAPLYLGGVPDFKKISKANGFTSGYIGRDFLPAVTAPLRSSKLL